MTATTIHQEPVRRFAFEVRDADHKFITATGGFATRDAAETAAGRKRDEIARRGWRMTVHVTEAHEVTP